MDTQPTNVQKLRDTIMSIWTKISEECFQHLVESMPRIIKAVMKVKKGVQPGTSKVYLIGLSCLNTIKMSYDTIPAEVSCYQGVLCKFKIQFYKMNQNFINKLKQTRFLSE